MRIEVDYARCQGHAMCALVAPEVFDTDEVNGQAVVLYEKIPVHLEAKAAAAVAGCPERALSARP